MPASCQNNFKKCGALFALSQIKLGNEAEVIVSVHVSKQPEKETYLFCATINCMIYLVKASTRECVKVFNLAAHRFKNPYYAQTQAGSRLLQAVAKSDEPNNQRKNLGSRQQATQIDLCYYAQPYDTDDFDEKSLFLVVDKFGTVLVDLETQDVHTV